MQELIPENLTPIHFLGQSVEKSFTPDAKAIIISWNLETMKGLLS